MSSKIKNIIIFASIALVLIVLYLVFIKKSPQADTSLISATGTVTASTDANSQIGADFLSVLLSVKNISLNDSIFSDPAFLSLRDSSIELIPDGTEGRANPFAPIGTDTIAAPNPNPIPSIPSSTSPSTTGNTTPSKLPAY